MSGAYRGAPVKTARLLLFVAVIAALAGGGQAKEDTRSSEGGNLNCDGLIVTCPPDARLDCPLHILPEYTGWPAVMGEYPPFDTAFVDVGRKCGCSMTFVRVWRVIDAVGHCDTCMQIIAAEDNVPPIIECPPDVVFECDDIGDFGRATATDNCDPNPTISYKDTITFELCPWEFSGIRTWIARDRCGNMSTCEQKITIQDSKPPVIICCPPDTVVGPDVNI